jgi:hypothetical protein
MVVGAISMFGVDTAAGRAAETLVGPSRCRQPAAAEPATLSDTWPEGVARHVLARTDSTNAEALRLAPGLSGPAWIMAREQTAARGRRGRGWAMPAGNFAGTLVLRPQGRAGRGGAAIPLSRRWRFTTRLAMPAGPRRGWRSNGPMTCC